MVRDFGWSAILSYVRFKFEVYNCFFIGLDWLLG
ncbi:MAG: hypothetical protein JWR38_1201 [Mucilaginibacter sp.]|nr:hypothetical protein [Mucilaginibacter sp.]